MLKFCLGFVSKSKKDVICLSQKIRVLDQLHSGMSYSAVGCELNVNESQYGTSIKRKRNFNDLLIRLLWKVLKEHLWCVTKLLQISKRNYSFGFMRKKLNTIVRGKATEISGHAPQGQESAQPFMAHAGCHTQGSVA